MLGIIGDLFVKCIRQSRTGYLIPLNGSVTFCVHIDESFNLFNLVCSSLSFVLRIQDCQIKAY